MMNTITLGRPLDETLTNTILKTASDLFFQQGYEAVTMVKIAELSHTSRQAIYRRWENKQSLLIDSLHLFSPPKITPRTDTPAKQQLIDYVNYAISVVEPNPLAFRHLVCDLQRNLTLHQRFNERFIVPRSEILTQIIRYGINSGELESHLNIKLLINCIHGTLWLRILRCEPFDKQFAIDLIEMLL
ncbi:TetR/AcrR family transcriptional regulator [Pelistega ratti]|uniref:TetR/AcrR family transcriptional regulator n=1 Tax=Pelistega ratti TaxID=2652177 RepID=UPI001356B010|nr:TetR/AcrR family transcriptional regulator [Pelistega ratti]